MSDHKKAREREQQRKKESKLKNRPHFTSTTPSTSLLNQPYGLNYLTKLPSRNIKRRADGAVLNFSKSRIRDINKIIENFEKMYPSVSLLNLDSNFLASFPICLQLNNIKCICLRLNRFESFTLTNRMENLLELILSSNDLQEFPRAETIRLLPKLRKLVLNHNHIPEIPVSSIIALSHSSITVLNVASNKLTSIPPEIVSLNTLTSLNLSNNDITELPRSILGLLHLYSTSSSLDIHGNKLICPPQEIAQRNGMKSIAEYFKEADGMDLQGQNEDRAFNLAQCDSDGTYTGKSRHLKVLLVGHQDGGKNSLVDKLRTIHGTESNHSMIKDTISSAALHNSRLQLHVEEDLYSTCGLLIDSSLRAQLFPPSDSERQSSNQQQWKQDLKLNIWNFADKESYHPSHEAFFSTSTLHVIVWDIRKNMACEFDSCLQFWIDLIQARAPGATIMIVATHVDELDPATEQSITAITSAMWEHLRFNEELRVQDLLYSVQTLKNTTNRTVEESIKVEKLERLLETRPSLHPVVIPLSSLHVEGRNESILTLVNEFVTLATPGRLTRSAFVNSDMIDQHIATTTTQDKHPFGILDISLPKHYQRVKQQIDELRRRKSDSVGYCTIEELDASVQSQLRGGQAISSWTEEQKKESYERTKDAVVYWATVGEIMWFPSPTEADHNHADASDLHVLEHPPIPDIPKRIRLNSAASADSCISNNSEFANAREHQRDTDSILSDDCRDDLRYDQQITEAEDWLSSIVFLSPQWLKDSLKGIVSVDIKKKIQELRRQSNAEIAQQYFGSDTGASLFNGVVQWELIKVLLMSDGCDVLKKIKHDMDVLDFTLEIIRGVLIRLNIIIPIEQAELEDDLHQPLSTIDELCEQSTPVKAEQSNGGVEDDYGVIETSYLIPSLLTEPTERDKQQTGPRTRYAHADSVRLERRYSFSRFIPSSIIPRIIAKMYSQHGLVKASGPNLSTSDAESGITTDKNKCWSNTFIQEFGDCTVWVLFEYAPAEIEPPRDFIPEQVSSDVLHKTEKSETFKDIVSDFEKLTVVQEVEELQLYSAQPSPVSRRGGQSPKWNAVTTETSVSVPTTRPPGSCMQLRIISYSHLLHVQSSVQALDHHAMVVSEILSEYKGMIQPTSVTLCPVCQMKQMSESECGRVQHTSETSLRTSLDEMYSHFEEDSFQDKDKMLAEYLKWDKQNRLICERNGCNIKPDFLIQIPSKLLELFDTEQHYRCITSYIREDIIKQSPIYRGLAPIRPPTAAEIEYRSKEHVSGCIVYVLPIHAYGEQLAVLNTLSSTTAPVRQDLLMSKLKVGNTIISGCRISTDKQVSGGGECEMLILSSFLPRAVEEIDKHFLIGDPQNGWTHIAKYIKRPARQIPGKPSDAAFLRVICPIESIAINKSTIIMDIKSKYIPGFIYRNERPERLGQKVNHMKCLSLVMALESEMQIEQVVQAWGYSGQTLSGRNWARIVRKDGECCLISFYSDENLIGGPVLHEISGRVLGVVSRHLYKNGTQSAFYVASIRSLFQQH